MDADAAYDNPLWATLTTLHRARAIGDAEAGALRFPADIGPFLAVADRANVDPAAIAALVPAGDTVLFIGPRPAAPPPGLAYEDLGAIVQMRCVAPPASSPTHAIVSLADRRDDVRALSALVYPHFFRPRTQDLGRYFGIYAPDGRLAAMIGERLGWPGHREISAVCTHPDHAGRGLARELLCYLAHDLATGGVEPFLHVSPTNTRAIALYAQNGFVTRAQIAFAALRRT